MSEAALRAVLFDATGTLLHLREPVGATYARLARAHGAELPEERLQDAFARVLAAAPPMVFPDAPPGTADARERDWWRDRVRQTLRAADGTVRLPDFEAFFDALFRHYAGEAWTTPPGARPCLVALRDRGLERGVVSNFDRLGGILKDLDLADLLGTVVTPGVCGAAKPDPRIFYRALEQLGVETAAALYVGDNAPGDLAGARAAGLRAIDVTSLATLDQILETVDEPHAENCP